MPKRSTILSVIGGVALAGTVGAIGYFATKRLLSRSPAKCPDGEHVGAQGFDWPQHRSLFVDDAGFGEALEAFGYETDLAWRDNPDWSPCDESMREYVSLFQEHWNKNRSKFPDAPGEVQTNGLIDMRTIEAMTYVHQLQESGRSWILIYSDLEATGPRQLT